MLPHIALGILTSFVLRPVSGASLTTTTTTRSILAPGLPLRLDCVRHLQPARWGTYSTRAGDELSCRCFTEACSKSDARGSTRASQPHTFTTTSHPYHRNTPFTPLRSLGWLLACLRSTDHTHPQARSVRLDMRCAASLLPPCIL